MNSTAPQRKHFVLLIVAASAILLITMGVRQSTGLLLLPIVKTTGLSIVTVSFALAVGQFVWGAAQAAFGAVADRYGATHVLIAGAVILALGLGLTPVFVSETGVILTLGILVSMGAAAGSFSILLGATLHRVPMERRSMASGIINAGGSAGQIVFAPLMQTIIAAASWMSAMYAASVAALLTLPFVGILARANSVTDSPTAKHVAESTLTMREQLAVAARDKSYLLLHAGFFTCGFHIAFLTTHLPGDLQLCGLPGSVAANSIALIGFFNVAGSLSIGWLGQRYPMKYLLALLYATRAAVVLIYVLMPKTAFNVYLVAGVLGFTWLATVPPTAGLVGKLFGTKYLSTLFGLTLMSHQVGGFLGAWLGGVALTRTGSYQWMWYADIALALAAAIVNLPIREKPPTIATVPA